MNGLQRCLAAVRGEPADRTPVFPLLMFLAAERAGLSYRRYATDGKALAEAQLAARERFGLDAITACSDAFRLAADLGAQVNYPEQATPHAVEPLVRTASDLAALRRPDPAGGRMADRRRAVEEMVRAAGRDCLVLGWVDLPFAEACSLCGVASVMTLTYDDPALLHRLLEFLTPLVSDFALSQLEAGAPMIGAGDAAASLISPAFYREFALPYERRVFEAVQARGGMAKLHICGNTTALLPDMIRAGAELYNVDHLVDFQKAAGLYQAAGRAFKGNLDPASDLAFASAEHARQEALRRIRLAGQAAAPRPPRYLLSAGCEVPATVSDEVFRAFCQAPLSAQA